MISNKGDIWVELQAKAKINVIILGVVSFVLRNFIYTHWQYLRLFRQMRHFDYKQHRDREVLLALLITIALGLINLIDLTTFAFDVLLVECNGFKQDESLH